MDMDQAAVFLAGSILTGLGFIIVAGCVVIINNILHKYWKPIEFTKWIDGSHTRFATEEEVKKLDQSKK